MSQGLTIKIFADGADVNDMKQAYKQGIVKGFTTNPTLMKKAGVTNYAAFAHEVLAEIKDLPISFEVFSDDLVAMEREASIIAGWGKNVNVKIPITNTKGESTMPLVKRLSANGAWLNVTAILTVDQVKQVADTVSQKSKTIVSVFAGRIADTGRDPMPYMKECAKILLPNPNAELLWASSRELLNIFQAQECGCKIITVTPEILKKMAMVGKDLQELSLDTVRMFYKDAQAAAFSI